MRNLARAFYSRVFAERQSSAKAILATSNLTPQALPDRPREQAQLGASCAHLGSPRLLLQRFQHSEEGRGLFDSTKLDAECLHLNEQIMNIDDLVADQWLQEDTYQAHQAILHVLVLDVFAWRNAIGDVEMDKLRRKVHWCRQSVHDL